METMYTVQRINRDGSPGSDPVVIDRSPGYQTGGDAAYDPLNNRSLVVFNAGSGQDWLFRSFVSPAATASAVFTLATDVDSASLDNLQVAYNAKDAEYTIVWDSNGYLQHGDIRAARVAVDGTPIFTRYHRFRSHRIW